jgi:hypothetical protein
MVAHHEGLGDKLAGPVARTDQRARFRGIGNGASDNILFRRRRGK